MSKLNSVIFLRILRTTFYSTFALTLCAWIVQSSRYLDMLNKYNISLAKFFKFSSYLCVDIIAIILPISLAISSAFIFHRFVQSNQLTAMQSSGISPLSLLKPLMLLSFMVTAYLYINNSYLSPNSWASFRKMEFEIKNNIEPPESAGSIFSINGFSVYAREYIGNFSFNDLFILDLRESEKSFSYHAKSGMIKNNMLFLQNGERIEVDGISKKSSITKFETYQYDLQEILKVEKKATQPNEMSMRDLFESKNNTDSNNPENISRYALFHQKIASPILAFIFSLMSFLLIILAPYNRNRKYYRIFLLILFIVFFQGTFFWISNAAAKDWKFIEYIYALIGVPIITILPIIFIKSR